MNVLTDIKSSYKTAYEDTLQLEDDFNGNITSNKLNLNNLNDLLKKVDSVLQKFVQLKEDLRNIQINQNCMTYLSSRKVFIINATAGVGTILSQTATTVSTTLDETYAYVKWSVFGLGSIALWLAFFSNAYFAKKSFEEGETNQALKLKLQKSLKKGHRQARLLRDSIKSFYQLATEKQKIPDQVNIIIQEDELDTSLDDRIKFFLEAYQHLIKKTDNIIPVVIKASLSDDDPLHQHLHKVESIGKVLLNAQENLPVNYLHSSSGSSIHSWQTEEAPREGGEEKTVSIQELNLNYRQAWMALNLELIERFGLRGHMNYFDTANGVRLSKKKAVYLKRIDLETDKPQKLKQVNDIII